MNEQEIKKIIRNVPDFPKKGIQFKDLTTAFLKAECNQWFEEKLTEHYKELGITKICGIESRGFIIAPLVAKNLSLGFVPVRKKGKLPADTIEESYSKEYGIDTIEIHKDAITENDVVMIHDDLLATGGTMLAAIHLMKKAGVKKIYTSFLVELDGLKGRDILQNEAEVFSLIHY